MCLHPSVIILYISCTFHVRQLIRIIYIIGIIGTILFIITSFVWNCSLQIVLSLIHAAPNTKIQKIQNVKDSECMYSLSLYNPRALCCSIPVSGLFIYHHLSWHWNRKHTCSWQCWHKIVMFVVAYNKSTFSLISILNFDALITCFDSAFFCNMCMLIYSCQLVILDLSGFHVFFSNSPHSLNV